MKKQSEQGFSLVELMAVIAIISILMGVAVGAYSNLREKNRVQSAKEEIVSILQQARLKALSSGESQKVSVDWTNNSISYSIRVSESKSYERVNLEGYTCSPAAVSSTGSGDFTFTRRGTVGFTDKHNIRISSSSSDQVYIIKINSVTGRIEVVDGGSC